MRTSWLLSKSHIHNNLMGYVVAQVLTIVFFIILKMSLVAVGNWFCVRLSVLYFDIGNLISNAQFSLPVVHSTGSLTNSTYFAGNRPIYQKRIWKCANRSRTWLTQLISPSDTHLLILCCYFCMSLNSISIFTCYLKLITYTSSYNGIYLHNKTGVAKSITRN